MKNEKETVERVRQFNREYTVLQGFLSTKYLGTDFSVTETRILYELKSCDYCTGQMLANKLLLDKGYISRSIKKLEDKQLIKRIASEQDKRVYKIVLTKLGEEHTHELIQITNSRILEMIQGLSDKEQKDLCDAMSTISKLLKLEVQ